MTTNEGMTHYTEYIISKARIEQALKALEEEGRKHYKPEFAQGVPAFQAIGLAIASVNDSATNILHLAYSALEDWNNHDLCAVIEWAHPLYNQRLSELDIQRVQRMMNKKGVTVSTDWDPARLDYNSKIMDISVIATESTH